MVATTIQTALLAIIVVVQTLNYSRVRSTILMNSHLSPDESLPIINEKLDTLHAFNKPKGTHILPISRVTVSDANGEEILFCSLCCAKNWLDSNSHKKTIPQVSNGQASITVVDEISGQEIDASLAYWVQSNEYSRQENKSNINNYRVP